jgi:MarR family transcriptional regulator, organic hydroperoxide resistance regulator
MTADPTPDRRLFFLLHRAQHAALRFADRELIRRLQITSAQLGALFFLRKNDGCLLKELSRGLALNNSAITGLVDRMAAQDLVERRPCDRDGRAFRVFMTPLGREKVEAGFPLLREWNDQLKEDFTDDQLETVYRFLATVAERLESKSGKPAIKEPAS